jgi:hypothetical protein
MNSRTKSVVKGALIATVLCGCLPIWQYWAFSSWEASQRFGILPIAALSFVIAVREEGFLRAIFHFYFINFILLAFVWCIGGAVGFFRSRKPE